MRSREDTKYFLMPSVSLMSKFRGMPAKTSISAAVILRNIKAVMPAMTNTITKRERRFDKLISPGLF